MDTSNKIKTWKRVTYLQIFHPRKSIYSLFFVYTDTLYSSKINYLNLSSSETTLSSTVAYFLRRCSFCGSFLLFMFRVCRAFLSVYLLQHCGHLLGKGYPIGSLVCDVVCFVTFPWGIMGQVWTWLYRFLIFVSLLTFITTEIQF